MWTTVTPQDDGGGLLSSVLQNILLDKDQKNKNLQFHHRAPEA